MRLADAHVVDAWRLARQMPSGRRAEETVRTDHIAASISRVPARAAEPGLRCFPSDQLYLVLQGQGILSLSAGGGEQRIPIKKGSHFVVPAGTPHRFTNLGTTLMILGQAGPPG